MLLFQILKFLLFILGGLSGLVVVLLSYIYQLADPVPPQLSELSPQIQAWFRRGSLVDILDKKMFVLTQGSAKETIILIHGFPTSSFDYFDVIDQLSEKYRVVVFDHIGFGFSDKPSSNYTYSLLDQAEQALALWTRLGIKAAHVISHDMGDSVLTEILSRKQRGMLPEYFDNFFKSITFTNGGMVYDLINKRLSQKILNSNLGEIFSKLSCRIGDTGLGERFGRSQLGSVWSPKYGNIEKRELDKSNIDALNKYKNGKCIFHKTISYLSDRARFEQRWFESLSKLELPVQLMWGDSDSVAPISIPQTLAKLINPNFLTFTVLPDAGHFLTLERPELWINRVINFVSKHKYAEEDF